LSVVHSHVLAGAKLLLSDHTVMQKPFWERLRGATSLPGVPFHYEMLLRMRLERADLPQMRVLTQAGGHLPQVLVEKVHAIARARGWKFHVMYGQTEAGPRISWLPHDEVPDWPGCIGRAIPGVRLSLAEGELIVESPSVAMGHAENRDDLARGDDLGGRLVTGDLAEEAAPGLYRITGRRSRFLKLQGNRVGLQDVEERLHAAGFEVHCTGTEDDLRICIEDGDPEAVRRAAVDLFSFPARSVTVRRLAGIPRRANGKVDYPELLRLAMETPT
jgi:long-chain acyl-CoA synthetase